MSEVLSKMKSKRELVACALRPFAKTVTIEKGSFDPPTLGLCVLCAAYAPLRLSLNILIEQNVYKYKENKSIAILNTNWILLAAVSAV